MSADEVLRYLRRQPFVAFRIHLTDGTVDEVRDPDQCLVTRTAIHVAIPSPRGYARDIAAYALIHVNRLEPVAVEQAS